MQSSSLPAEPIKLARFDSPSFLISEVHLIPITLFLKNDVAADVNCLPY